MNTYEPCIMGVDPGASGAVAFYYTTFPHLIAVEDVPVVGKEIDAAELARRIVTMGPVLAVVEAVHAMPKQGVSSVFTFGQAFGTVLGVIAALNVPVERVTPGRWKKHFRLDADKERARALAIQMWPSCPGFSRKKDHGRAEAALLARYGADLFAMRSAA
jgi:hypothetical protein